jgi:hypothetical protein
LYGFCRNEEVAAAANGTARIDCNKNFQRGGEEAGAAAVESISENIYSRKAKRRKSLWEASTFLSTARRMSFLIDL